MSTMAGMIALAVILPAHSDHAIGESYGWVIEPLPLVGLVVMALAYTALAVGAHRRGQPVALARLLLFAAGVLTIVVALFSPIDSYGEQHSPAVHMIQHEMLLMVGPLLFVAGLEQRLVMPVSRLLLRPIRSHSTGSHLWRRFLDTVGNPWFAASVWSLITLGWHLPVMYNLSLANRMVHNIEHVSLMGAGMLFWVVLIGRLPSVHHTTFRERIGALAVAMAVGGIVGAAFIWWPTMLYSGYLGSRPWLGLSPWDDQRLAGVIMMVVDMPIILGAMLVTAGRWAHRDVRLDAPESVAAPAELTTTGSAPRRSRHHA